MIANELNRAKNWIEKKDTEEVKNCYERALELLDLTIATAKDKNRLREYLRLREMMGKFYIEKRGDLKFNSQLFTCICTLSKEVSMLDKKLLEILACPVCKSSVKLKGDKIICRKCKKYYPVKNGIPVMLVDEAKDLKEKDYA